MWHCWVSTVSDLESSSFFRVLRVSMHANETFAIAPWVHPTHSQVKALILAEMIPEFMIRNWNQVNKVLATSLMPMKASSSGTFGDIISSFGFASKTVDDSAERSLIEEYHGVSKEVQDVVDQLQDDYAWAEETVGANDESMLCLKKAGPGLWGSCENYSTFVRDLASSESRGSIVD
jgi:hypothetical protein